MFGISVSGIKNSQKHIDVTSNNIANANSYGFKKSRAEFADVYASSVFGNSKTAAGMGVQNTTVSQQFVQGALSGDTGNSLDMAIQGNGFFVLSSAGGGNTFTRNGAFQVNKDGYIVTATNDYLQGWDVNEDGTSTSLDLNATHNIKIPTDTGAPKPTGNISIGANFPADKDPVEFPELANDPVNNADWPADFDYKYGIPRGADGTIDPTGENANFMQYYTKFDPKDSSTYTASTSQTIHDSLGREHTLTYYIINMGPDGKDSNNTAWNVIPFIDGKPVDVKAQGGVPGTMDQNPIMMSVPSDSTSSVAGSNFFGFQLKFGPDGEVLPNGQIPSKLEFVNQDEAGTLVGSLRNHLFGAPGEEAASGTWDGLGGATNGQFIDRTFEDILNQAGDAVEKEAHYKGGNGSLGSTLGTGVDYTQNINLTFKATQYGSSNFNITEAPTNDGYATGLLLSVNVDDNGILQAEYSNGRRVNIAKIALADFTNPQGLTKIGESQWKASLDSGNPIAKEANVGSAGAIKGSNLELSNVDLTAELVELITAQRNYQANAQSLQTNSTVMDSILNIR